MPYKTIILQKCKYYINYITNNNITDKFLIHINRKIILITYIFICISKKWSQL